MNTLPSRPTWIEIDAAALRDNAAHLRRIIGPHVMLMAVVKANAYGHDAALVAPLV
ncbi:MAG: alanine racemase, partial [Caldilineaceae bacterium]|nr:alanine racemase [Caldilineaceae bacterium]